MKKITALIFTIIMLCCPSFGITAYAADERNPVYAEAVAEGTYNIQVTSSSSMFRIIECELTCSGGEMTAVITLSGQGYGKLFMGTGEEALSADESEYIPFVENSEGKYTYTIPVDALDTELDCAGWSIRKEKWYDRTIVFNADTLPDGVVERKLNLPLTIGVIAVIIISAAIAAVIIKKHRRK